MNIRETKCWEILREIKRASQHSLSGRKIRLPVELKNAYKISEALNVIKKRWPEQDLKSDNSESPVFIFSAGWRSGSTLMQRLVVSSGEVSIWGEPFGEAGIIPRLAYSLAAINFIWPPDNYFKNNSGLQELSNQWIANLTPPVCFLKKSHTALLQKWLGESAKSKFDISRWGLKEVRLTIDHAKYLKWLFPNARFIFIYRNLFDAYKSWRGNSWYGAWPGYFSWSPVVFARHWKLLLKGYLNGYKDVDGIIIKFEDLVAGKIPLKEIADHIGVNNIDPSVLNKKIWSPKSDKKQKGKKITRFERIILSFTGGSLLKKTGYKYN